MRTKIKELEGLRGIAAIGVAFLWHYQHFKPAYYPFAQVLGWFYTNGYFLVDLFFIISGFILTHVYRHQILENKIALTEFFKKRLSRLYPLHFITLQIVFIGQYVYLQRNSEYFVYPRNSWLHYVLNLFLVHYGYFNLNFSLNGPSWSIAMEFFAYFLFFITYFALKKSRFISFVAPFYLVLGYFIFRSNIETLFITKDIGRVLSGFFMGVIVYDAYNLINPVAKKFKKLFSLLFLATAVLGIIFGKTGVGYVLIVFPSFVFLSLLIPPLQQFLSLRFFVFLGKISYSVYMWHFPIQLILVSIDSYTSVNFNYSSNLFFFAYILLTLAVSSISYFYIEEPLKNVFRKKYFHKTV